VRRVRDDATSYTGRARGRRCVVANSTHLIWLDPSSLGCGFFSTAFSPQGSFSSQPWRRDGDDDTTGLPSASRRTPARISPAGFDRFFVLLLPAAGGTVRARSLRRWIILIFACWLTHNSIPSGAASLSCGRRRVAPAQGCDEDSPTVHSPGTAPPAADSSSPFRLGGLSIRFYPAGALLTRNRPDESDQLAGHRDHRWHAGLFRPGAGSDRSCSRFCAFRRSPARLVRPRCCGAGSLCSSAAGGGMPGRFHHDPPDVPVARAGDPTLTRRPPLECSEGPPQNAIRSPAVANRRKSPTAATSVTALTRSTPRSACSARTRGAFSQSPRPRPSGP